MQEKRLTRAAAADFLMEHGFPISKRTLQKYATVGGGPEYERFGNHALYRPSVLLAWALAKAKRRASTSEAA